MYDVEILLKLSTKLTNSKKYIAGITLIECKNDKLLDLIDKFRSYKKKYNKEYIFNISCIDYVPIRDLYHNRSKHELEIAIWKSIDPQNIAPRNKQAIDEYKKVNKYNDVCLFSYYGDKCIDNEFYIGFDSENLPTDIYDFDNCIRKLERLNMLPLLPMTISNFYLSHISNYCGTSLDGLITVNNGSINVATSINEYTVAPPWDTKPTIAIEPRVATAAAKLDKYVITTKEGCYPIMYDYNNSVSIIEKSDIIYGSNFEVENVKINKDTIIVFWKSGDKTIVTHKPESKNDKFDIEKAIYAAFTKKALSFGNTAKERSIDNIVSKCKEMIDKSIEKNKKIEEKKKKK